MNVTKPLDPRPTPASSSAVALGVIASLPRNVKLAAGAVLLVAVLLGVGVPLATLIPFAGLAGCLGMHLFMGHGSHGTGGDEH